MNVIYHSAKPSGEGHQSFLVHRMTSGRRYILKVRQRSEILHSSVWSRRRRTTTLVFDCTESLGKLWCQTQNSILTPRNKDLPEFYSEDSTGLQGVRNAHMDQVRDEFSRIARSYKPRTELLETKEQGSHRQYQDSLVYPE
jgi:hypothetical protein